MYNRLSASSHRLCCRAGGAPKCSRRGAFQRVRGHSIWRARRRGRRCQREQHLEELAALKQTVARLEDKIDELVQQPSAFSSVEVRVVDERGKPQSGFEVQLNSAGDVQAAEASGVSNEDGIGLKRDLPYGKYWMRVRGQGWYARELVTLEVGKPLELTLVAPAQDQFGKLALEASLQPEAVKGLVFGLWEVRGRNGWGNRIVPGPDEMQGEDAQEDWKTFPSLANGVEVVAVSVYLSIERRIEQPDGSHVAWEWRRSSAPERSPHLRWLVQSDGTVQPILKVTEGHKTISKQAGTFQELAPDDDSERSSHSQRLGYHHLKLGNEQHSPAAITLPSGQIKLSIDDIFGRPSPDVLHAIDKPAESSAGQLWLRAAVTRDSTGWLGRLLGDSWSDSSDSAGHFEIDIDLVPGERQTVTVGTGK